MRKVRCQTLTERRWGEFTRRRLSDCMDHAASLLVAHRASVSRR